MQSQCGLYGGSFNPPHQGHVRCLIEAANQCETLVVVISNGARRDEIDVRVRYRWLYQLTKHMDNVRLFVLEDDAEAKEAYTAEHWARDAARVKAFAGRPLDVVFCGDDYDERSLCRSPAGGFA